MVAVVLCRRENAALLEPMAVREEWFVTSTGRRTAGKQPSWESVSYIRRQGLSMRRTDLVSVHGESQNDPRYNEFLAFTLDFVEALRTGAFWSTE